MKQSQLQARSFPIPWSQSSDENGRSGSVAKAEGQPSVGPRRVRGALSANKHSTDTQTTQPHTDVDKILQDRIRTWARAKAHGPSPLTGTPPRTHAAEAGNERREGRRDRPAEDTSRNAFTSFWLTIRAILFSSIVNVLLIFVPVGFAVRMSSLPLLVPSKLVILTKQ